MEGYTNFLWTVWLAPFEALGADVPLVANVASALCGLALLALLVRFAVARSDGSPLRAAATGLFAGSLPPIAVWATSGLETMPFALAVFGTYSYLVLAPDRPRALPAAVCALAAALLRADGVAWVGAILAAALFPWGRGMRSSRLWAALLVAGVVAVGVAAHVLWRHGYYGEWLPNTARAKTALTGVRLERGWNYLVLFLFAVPSVALVGVCAAAAAGVARGRGIGSTAQAAIPCAFAAAYAVYVGGDFMALGRFLVPAMPFVVLLFVETVRRIPSGAGVASFALVAAGLGVAASFDAIPVPRELRQRFHFRHNRERAMSEIVQWRFMGRQQEERLLLARALALHTVRGESLTQTAIGAVGYYTELTIFDRYGLVSPEVLDAAEPRPRASPGHDFQVSRAFFLPRRPTYVMAFVTPESSPPRAELGPEVLGWLDGGEDVELVRKPLPARKGFPAGAELRLVRFSLR